VKEAFRSLLHEYKVNAFKLSHDHDSLEKLTDETLHYTEETLKNAYHYHFNRLPDANRVEIINMINDYVVEALLPPVVEKLLKRIVILEKRQDMMVDMVSKILETLSNDGAAGPDCGQSGSVAG
jgi:hypothetical protein